MSDTTMQPRYKCTRLITLQKKPSSFMFLGKVIHLDQDNYVTNTMTAELLDILEASPHIFIKTAQPSTPVPQAMKAQSTATTTTKEAAQELDVPTAFNAAEPVDSSVVSDIADLDIPEYSAEPVTKQRRKRVQSQK